MCFVMVSTTFKEIRESLEGLFASHGFMVTFKKRIHPIYNSRGEATGFDYEEETKLVLPYNNVGDNRSIESFGELRTGEMDLALPFDFDVDLKDVAVFQGVEYEVVNKQTFTLGHVVMQVVRVRKIRDLDDS